MRAFLGLSLPEDVRASLAALQRALAASQADVKWVEPPNLHVTLTFLDEISDAQRHAIERLVARVAGHEEPFLLGLGSLGAFPSLESPRVVWVGLTEGSARLARLAEAIEREGGAISLGRGERSFAPHLTLGRVRSPRRRDALAQQLRTAAWQPPAPWRVTAVTFYQSILTANGPRYAMLAEVPLTG